MRLLTLKSILLATDLSDASLAPLRTASRLATLSGARLHVLHVVDRPGAGSRMQVEEHLRTSVPDAPAPASIIVVPGSPAEVIVEQAGRCGADTIVLGPHRRGGTGGELGGTASSVVRTASCPCLVVATELRLPLERIVAPIDLSRAADGALSVALSWASALRPPRGRAHLITLHVSPTVPSGQPAEELHAAVEGALARAGGSVSVEIGERVVAAADPVEEILASARSDRADLLVMGTRGEAPAVPGLGSVSAAVTRETPCPILLVPPAVWNEHAAR